MFALITGGSGSGKSEYAETLAVNLSKKEGLPLYYIATMVPYGEEGKRRVERHRKLRAGKGFETIECFLNLKEQRFPERGVVLLECLSNLTANEMFEEEGAGEKTVEAVLEGIETLKERCVHLVAVTNDIFSDGMTYDKITEQYQENLGKVNRELACAADQMTEVVCGIPLPIKEQDDFLQRDRGERRI